MTVARWSATVEFTTVTDRRYNLNLSLREYLADDFLDWHILDGKVINV